VTLVAFVEQQWMILVFPTFKASTRDGYKTVLSNHVLPAWQTWRLRDIERPIIHAGKVMRAKLIEPMLLLRVMHTGGVSVARPKNSAPSSFCWVATHRWPARRSSDRWRTSARRSSRQR